MSEWSQDILCPDKLAWNSQTGGLLAGASKIGDSDLTYKFPGELHSGALRDSRSGPSFSLKPLKLPRRGRFTEYPSHG